MLKFYNTLTKKKEEFKPSKDKEVDLYTCGPTVYWFAHVGNLRTYIFEDLLKRTLKYNDYKVNHVMNITDVGHLTSDSDGGEDKMVKALKREGKELNEESILEIADYYTKAFKKDLGLLNIQYPDVFCKATETIPEQIELVKKIIENGYAYETDQAVYFDTHKLESYTELANQDLKGLQEGVSIEKKKDKKNPTDFALWIKLKGEHKNHIMNWDSPWGKGFPGWHVECSAMSIKYLGEEIDIHCGGIDHIPVHHTNERAQNIAALGKPVVRFWMHGEFLISKEEKMSKSKGNIMTIAELTEKGIDPLAYRYLCLNAHYRSKLSFSLESLKNAEHSLENLKEETRKLKKEKDNSQKTSSGEYLKKFKSFVNDDLDIPKALALAWKTIKDDEISSNEKYNLLIEFDKVFGLGLKDIKEIKIPEEVRKLVQKREKYRKEKEWKEADKVRKKINKLGFKVEDTQKGSLIKKK